MILLDGSFQSSSPDVLTEILVSKVYPGTYNVLNFMLSFKH